ncbi:Vacuolar protein sorting-associated protein 62 [Heracleum sosnowskyi]|uniref:Vacuolar protein sorting-associated protein 62 n=1 Tax=Heracleum sosnowskyi TaxID=360622 RepID=A0AAD8JC26_9APIA|nr:Vacuolar protein sorting-associated protein 62 [Heracleum sosnowskyi]
MTRIKKLNPYSISIIFIGLCFLDSAFVSCRNPPFSRIITSKKGSKPLPVETTFKIPAPIPKWPSGNGFASGTIDLGEVKVSHISTFSKVWTAYEGGPDNVGATFYEPISVPQGFSILGYYSQPNNQVLYGWVVVAKAVTNDQSRPALTLPTDYTLVWSSDSQKLKQDGLGYIWLPVPSTGYKAVGHVVTNSSGKPSLDKIRCVRSDLTEDIETGNWIWGPRSSFNVYSSRPSVRGIQASSVATGTFVAKKDKDAPSLSSLKNIKNDLSSMPNLDQVQALFKAYSPVVYFHPKEEYFPSSVSWFFQNGALLYTKGQESKPVQIEPTGSNLPQDGSDDGAYWLDLPSEKTASENVKKGNLPDAGVYLHIKPALGATFTDIAVWIFYPFNGAARAKIEFLTVSLGRIGEHVGDWEHVTLRISNFDGELKSVYFSQHNKGSWVSVSNLEFEKDNKPVVYASLHGHAAYPQAGLVVEGKASIGIRNDTSRGNAVMDTGSRYLVVGAEYLGASKIVEPPWLNYARKWGPKITYNIDEELRKVKKLLPGMLKNKFDGLVKSLPPEVLGEVGPTGPKWKDNWSGDERV